MLLFWLFILFIFTLALTLLLFLPPLINNPLVWIKLFAFFLFDTKFILLLLLFCFVNKAWLSYWLVIYWLLLLLCRCELFVVICWYLLMFSLLIWFLVLLGWLNSGRLIVYCGDDSYCGVCCRCRFYSLFFRLILVLFCFDVNNYCFCWIFYWLYWLMLFYLILYGFMLLFLLVFWSRYY